MRFGSLADVQPPMLASSARLQPLDPKGKQALRENQAHKARPVNRDQSASKAPSENPVPSANKARSDQKAP